MKKSSQTRRAKKKIAMKIAFLLRAHTHKKKKKGNSLQKKRSVFVKSVFARTFKKKKKILEYYLGKC